MLPFQSYLAPSDATKSKADNISAAEGFKPIIGFSHSASGMPFNTLLPLDLIDKQDNGGMAVFEGKQSLGWGYRLIASNITLLLGVLLGHGLLLFLLVFLWRSQQSESGLSQADRGPKVSALKAYFIYAPSTQPNLSNSATFRAEASTQTVTIQPVKVLQDKIVESAVIQSKLAPKPVLKPATTTETDAVQEPQSADATAVKSVSTTKASAQPAQSQILESNPEGIGAQGKSAQGFEASSASVGLFTQQYFERQREQALDDLVIEQADKFTRKSNMSEMSPEMEVLFVPNADDFGGTTSLDLPLDPNRIVRKGDTCYRVVQVGTQVNPYAENLGFPFDCSGKKINQAIDDAIQSRLNKMMLKPHQ